MWESTKDKGHAPSEDGRHFKWNYFSSFVQLCQISRKFSSDTEKIVFLCFLCFCCSFGVHFTVTSWKFYKKGFKGLNWKKIIKITEKTEHTSISVSPFLSQKWLFLSILKTRILNFETMDWITCSYPSYELFTSYEGYFVHSM